MSRPTQAWQRAMAWRIMDGLGARQTSRMRYAIIAWQIAETGDNMPRNNNPFNMFQLKGPLYAFDTFNEGIDATVNLLNTKDKKFAKWAGYDKVVKAARNNDPLGFIDALAKSRWDIAGYGTRNGRPNLILTVYKELVAGLPGKHWLDGPSATADGGEE